MAHFDRNQLNRQILKHPVCEPYLLVLCVVSLGHGSIAAAPRFDKHPVISIISSCSPSLLAFHSHGFDKEGGAPIFNQ